MKLFILAWFIAQLMTFFVGSIAHSQFVLAELTSIGISIPDSIRLSMTADGLMGLFPGYGAVIAIGLLLSFAFSIGSQRQLQTGYLLHLLSGFIAILAIHALMYPVMEITLIASVRSFNGLLASSHPKT